MQERSLLLLGILRTQSQHGYQINEFIENNLSCLVQTKKATAYATLERLHQQGYVDVGTEQVGNRPPRKVYSVTAKGEAAFFEMLRMQLAEPDPNNLTGDVALMFIHELSEQDAAALLKQRLDRLDEVIADLEATPAHTNAMGVDLAVARQKTLLQTDRAWLDDLIVRLATSTPQE